MCKVWKKNGGKKKKKNLCQIVTQQRYSGNGRLGGMCFGETGAKVNKWWKWINSRFEESSHPASSQNPNHVSQSTTLRKNSTYRNHKKVSFWWEIPAHITWPIFHLQPFTSSISRSYGHWGENLATTAGCILSSTVCDLRWHTDGKHCTVTAWPTESDGTDVTE